MLWVNSAGNEGPGSGCTLRGFADMLSVFTVGGVARDGSGGGDNTWACTENPGYPYLGCDVYSGSPQGGPPIRVDGSWLQGPTSIDTLTAACPRYTYNLNGTTDFGYVCGTSFAAPQVAGAALQIKDWWAQMWGVTAITQPARLFTVMLGMAERRCVFGYTPSTHLRESNGVSICSTSTPRRRRDAEMQALPSWKLRGVIVITALLFVGCTISDDNIPETSKTDAESNGTGKDTEDVIPEDCPDPGAPIIPDDTCEGLDEATCESRCECRPVFGDRLDGPGSGYAGCWTAFSEQGFDKTCRSAVTCAQAQATSPAYRFNDMCIPDGWEIISCLQ